MAGVNSLEEKINSRIQAEPKSRFTMNQIEKRTPARVAQQEPAMYFPSKTEQSKLCS
jgi:hypothetical protein